MPDDSPRTVLLRGARVVTPTGVVDRGHVLIDGGTIAAVGPGDGTAPDGAEVVDLGGATVLPGFVDMHTHGGGGATYTTGDADEARRAAAFHLAHGTTTTLASLVTAPPELMVAATEAYQPLVADGTLAGLHYEGPYLSQARCGAQNPAYLRDPDLAELATLLDIGGVRMVTVAPERAGARDAIRYLVERGVVAAVGHTDASYEQTLAAVEAGATAGTHVCNGMRPIHHREPGPIVALLRSASVTCEFIADGHHLHDGMLSFGASTAGPNRTALVTDAMAAAGMSDGAYDLGGQAVTVLDGVARLTEGGSIAGSTLTMDAAVRRALGAGIPLVDVARMAATTPARTIGLTDRGALVAGLRADLVVLDADLAVRRVMRGGGWL
ncbi:MAG TPA: N-acetylglucosamine-6-phosphate deacetylase [Actinocatenispora sp.]